MTGRYDLAFEFIAVTSMTPTARWNSKFWIWSVHVSTCVEVDTMVLRITDHDKMTWPPAYFCTITARIAEGRAVLLDDVAASFFDT